MFIPYVSVFLKLSRQMCGIPLQENIELVQQQYIGKIMLIRDFNADPNSTNGPHLNNFCTVNGLSKHINQPTRITDRSSSLLDQCLINLPSVINKVEILPPLSTCDHSVISILCNLQLPKLKIIKELNGILLKVTLNCLEKL